MIYFDHNATTPIIREAKEAWVNAADQYIGNPSSPHRLGKRADRAIGEAREQLASLLDCDPTDIIWTAGATESNNTVFHHLAQTLDPETEVWVSSIEHPCCLNAARHYFGPRTRLIPVGRSGVVDMEWLRSELTEKRPGLIAVLAANNETGVLQPWEEIRALCREHEVPFFCDAAQWLGKLPAKGLGHCDYLSGCAHKFGGPKGIGFLKLPPGERFRAFLRGGNQEEGRRAGTENVPGIMAMMAALNVCQRRLEAGEHERHKAIREEIEATISRLLPECELVGHGEPRLWNTISVLMPEVECQSRWLVKLDKLGYAVSTGSACASGKEEPSHVLEAMRYPPEQSDRVLRFSSGWETTRDEWDSLVTTLREVYKELAPAQAKVAG